MKHILILFCILLAAGSNAFASAEVNELQLSHQNGEVTLKIYAEGTFQYAHEIAEAKDGKPFRVLVDLFPAIHDINQKDFYELPSSIVKSIRTSQYSVEPTNIVRVVLDLKGTAVYRIEKKGNWIYIFIPDAKTTSFPVWSSKKSGPTVKKKLTSGKMAAKSEDSQKSVIGVSQKESLPVKSVSPKTNPDYTYRKPESSSVIDLDRVQAETVRKPIKTKPVNNESADPKKTTKTEELASNSMMKPQTDKTEKTSQSAVTKETKVKKAESPVKQTKVETAKTNKVDQVKKSTADKKLKKVKKSGTSENAKTTSGSKKATSTVAQKPATKNSKSKKPTSRFRRQPAFSKKMKGTIVAEFPKRMVIKYRAGNPRDPFASLIDKDASIHDKPNERKIPDIETSRLVGILESTGSKNRALLEDMDGYGYILKAGDKVKKGYVSKILSEKAYFQLFEYGWSRTVALRLNEGQ